MRKSLMAGRDDEKSMKISEELQRPAAAHTKTQAPKLNFDFMSLPSTQS